MRRQMSGISALRAQRVEEVSSPLSSTPRTRKADMPEIRRCASAGDYGAVGAERAIWSAIPCAACRHVTRYGNCGEPVAAGLVEHFGLVRHPDGGRGCPAFTRRRTDLEARAARLLAAGAIDQEDADLVRERWHLHSDEWRILLDYCAAAHEQRRGES